MSARTTKPATGPRAGLWTIALLSGVVAAAACSSSGSAARDASDADHQVGGDASLDGSGSEHQVGGDASLDDRPTDLANDRADDDGGDAVPSDASAETADVHDDGGSADADVRSEDGSSDGGATSDAASNGDALPCPTCAFYTTFMFDGEQTQAPAPGFILYQAGCGIDLFNGSDQAVSLAGVKVRYWFTSNTSQWNVICAGNCASVQTTNIVGIPPRNGADTYVEIVFAPGQLGAFSDVGPVQLSFNATDNNAFFDRPLLEDDYSFQVDPTTPDTRITVYLNNKLVWGAEP